MQQFRFGRARRHRARSSWRARFDLALLMLIVSIVCRGISAYGADLGALKFEVVDFDDPDIQALFAPRAESTTFPACRDIPFEDEVKERVPEPEEATDGTADSVMKYNMQRRSTLNTLEAKTPVPGSKPTVSAPAYSIPAAQTGLSGIRCQPSAESINQNVVQFKNVKNGPKQALLIDESGKVHSENYPAGLAGDATLPFKTYYNSEAEEVPIKERRVTGPVAVVDIKVDSSGNPILDAAGKVQLAHQIDGTYNFDRVGMVGVQTGGTLALAPEKRAAIILEQRNGKLCVPDLPKPNDAPILSKYGAQLRPIYGVPKKPLKRGCHSLNPWLRLTTSGLVVAGNINQSNTIGKAFADQWADIDTVIQDKSVFTTQAGVGMNNRILENIVAIFDDDEGQKMAARAGTLTGLFLKGVTANFSYTVGEANAVTDGNRTISTTHKPGYGVGLTVALDMQQLGMIVAFMGDNESRRRIPADTNYYFEAGMAGEPEEDESN